MLNVRNLNRSASQLIVSVVAVTLLSASLSLADDIRKSFDLAPGGQFVIDTDRGSVELVGTSGSGASMHLTSNLENIEDKFTITYNESPNRIEVRVERKGKRSRGWFNWGSDSSRLRFKIEVPRNTSVLIDSAGGRIDVDNIAGEVEADTSGGRIEITDVDGDVHADTSGGGIKILNVRGDVLADTSGGGINVENVEGAVTADTSGGGITIRNVDKDVNADTSGGSIKLYSIGGHIVASTSGGPIYAEFGPGNDAGGRLDTSGGGIRVVLDSGLSLDIDASSSGGSVTTDLPVTIQGKLSRGQLRGKLGGGGETLRLRTSGGGIKIEGR